MIDAHPAPKRRAATPDRSLPGHDRGAPPLIVIAGATATGKTDIAIRLAEALTHQGRPTAIISADSRQVFRGLDIGTAKVSAADRARVPHHGLDLADPDAPFSVADFAEHARSVLAELAQDDAVAILVGGTGFYLRAVARGLDTASLPSDREVRARLESDLIQDGPGALVERLETLAPILAASIETRNPRRVVRALEIAELRGDGALPAPLGYPGPLLWLGLTVEPLAHARRIETRAHLQFAAGLLDEAKALRERFDPALPAFSAIGYREAWAVLDGELTLAAAITLVTQRSVAFSKRQRTWFRSEPGITWLDASNDPADRAQELVGRLLDD